MLRTSHQRRGKCFCIDALNLLPPHGHAGVERLCPAEVLLGINNSMATDADFSCQVKVYSAFWVDNRTGLDLIFKDMDVPPVLANVPFLGKPLHGQQDARTCCLFCVHPIVHKPHLDLTPDLAPDLAPD